MWRSQRAGGLTASAFGVAVIIGVLALSFVPKANAADDMNDALMPVYNRELVDGAKGAINIVGAMGNEMQAGMLPALAEQMSLSAEELDGFLAQFPATAAALETLPEALGRFQLMVDTFDQQLGNYESIQSTRLTPIAWTLLLAGAATALLGVAGTTRRPRLRDEIAEAGRSRIPEPV